MIKRKLIIGIALSVSMLATICVGFSAYVITGQINKNISVNASQIEVNELKQTFLSYKGVNKNITIYGDDIIDDKFSINFSLNQQEYNENANSLSVNSGIGAIIKFPSTDLYNSVKNNASNNFVSFNYGDYLLSMKEGINYKANDEQCISFDDSSRVCNFHISLSKDHSNNDFYIQKIAKDNNLTDSSSVSGGQVIINVWTFTMNFDFGIVDQNLGYSTLFQKSDLSGVEITLLFEDYR